MNASGILGKCVPKENNLKFTVLIKLNETVKENEKENMEIYIFQWEMEMI